MARARAFQARGRGFESRFPLQPKSDDRRLFAHVAQVVERVLGKDEVSGSSPLVSSRVRMLVVAKTVGKNTGRTKAIVSPTRGSKRVAR